MSISIDKTVHKQSWWKAIFTHGKWYLLSSLITKGIGILLLPVYTRYLSTEEYGVLNTLNSIVQLLPIFISLYLDSAFGRFFHDYKQDPKHLAILFSSLYWFVFIFGGVSTTLFVLGSYFWLENIFNISTWPYAYLAFFPALLTQLGLMGDVFLRQSLQAKKTTFLLVLSTVINIGITLPLLIGWDLGVIARLWGGLVASIVLFCYYTAYFITQRLLVFKINTAIIKKCLWYSIPLIPNIAGGWIAGMSDRLIIAKYKDLASVGIYSLGFQLAFLLYVIQDSITQVQGPISMSGLVQDKENTKNKLARMSLVILSIMLASHFFILLFSKEIVFVFADTSYKDAYVVVGILSFVYVLSSQYRLFSGIISFHKKTWIVSSAGIMMGVVNLALNIWLVPRLGYLAAAYSTVLSTLFYTIWIVWWAQSLDSIPIPWFALLKLVGTYGLGVWLIQGLLEQDVSIHTFLLKVVCGVLLGILLVFFTKKTIATQG